MPQQEVYVPKENPTELLGKAVSFMKQQADTARVTEAANELERKRIEIAKDYTQQLGKNVLPKDGVSFTDRYMQQYKDRSSELAMDLTPDQQELFNKQATVSGMALQRGVNEHEAQQMMNHSLQQQTDTMQLVLDDAANNYNDAATLGVLQGKMDTSIQTLAQMKGLSDESVKLMTGKAYDQFHTSVIGRYAEKDDIAGARAYTNSHMNELTPDTLTKVNDYLDKKEAILTVTESVNTVWADTSLNLEQKADALRNQFKGKPEAQKAALEDLRERETLRTKQQGVYYGDVWDMVTGLNPNVPTMNFAKIQLTPQWLKLDGDQRAKFLTDWKTYNNHLTNTLSPQEQADKAIAFSYYMDNPRELLKYSDKEIKTLMPVVGPSYFDDLLRLRGAALKSEAGLSNVTLAADQFKATAEAYGYKGTGKRSQRQIEDYAALQHACINEIAEKQRKYGRPLNDEEQQKIFDKQLSTVVLKTSHFWRGQDEAPLFKVTNVDDLGYDPAKMEEAKIWLKNNGIKITPETVRDTITLVMNDPLYKLQNQGMGAKR
jgi:hypothetical protein